MRSLRTRKISRESTWFQVVVPGTSALLCFAAAFVFWFQPDSCAAVLVLPRWLWIIPGLFFGLLGWTKKRKRMAGIAIILWFLFAVVFVQELRSVFHWRTSPSDEWAAAHFDGKAIRVVSLNCSGDKKAAAEAGAYQPDIVFFQESPLRPELEEIATRLVGQKAESFCGNDVSIIARGKLTPVPVPDKASAPFAHARVQFPSGLTAEVIVARLRPYNISADLWSPTLWRNQCAIRQYQRQQLQRIAEEIEKIPRDVPLILGGDFNLPAGDKMFRILNARLTDTFRRSGTGWGDSLANDIPILRIDQIWCNDRFQPDSVYVRRTVNTDHRMVICNLFCR
jgi:vancomycin resistance protein VanJ